jgi:hypothetical protein
MGSANACDKRYEIHVAAAELTMILQQRMLQTCSTTPRGQLLTAIQLCKSNGQRLSYCCCHISRRVPIVEPPSLFVVPAVSSSLIPPNCARPLQQVELHCSAFLHRCPIKGHTGSTHAVVCVSMCMFHNG